MSTVVAYISFDLTVWKQTIYVSVPGNNEEHTETFTETDRNTNLLRLFTIYCP